MEGMDGQSLREICLDTDACIAIVKNLSPRKKILEIIENRAIILTSVTVFELLLRQTNIEEMEEFIKKMRIISFDKGAAEKASSIQRRLLRAGIVVDIRDLFIAATAISNNCELLTLNKKDFENIEGLKLLDF